MSYTCQMLQSPEIRQILNDMENHIKAEMHENNIKFDRNLLDSIDENSLFDYERFDKDLETECPQMNHKEKVQFVYNNYPHLYIYSACVDIEEFYNIVLSNNHCYPLQDSNYIDEEFTAESPLDHFNKLISPSIFVDPNEGHSEILQNCLNTHLLMAGQIKYGTCPPGHIEL